MAELWYYTINGQAREPVPVTDLQRLAADGTLKPADVVWHEGLPQWIRAGSVTALFSPEPLGSSDVDFLEEAIPVPDADGNVLEDGRPGRGRPRSAGGDAAGRRRRRRPGPANALERIVRQRAGMSTGAKWAIYGGLFGILVLVGAGYLVYFLTTSGTTRSFHLNTNQRTMFRLRFTGGKKVEIWVRSQRDTDIDLHVFDAANRLVALDIGPGKDCFIWFLATSTQTYRVELQNLFTPQQAWRNGPNSGTLTFRESSGRGLRPPPVFPQGNFMPPILQPPFQPPIFQPPVIQPPQGNPPNLQIPFGKGMINFLAQKQLNETDPLDKVQKKSRCKIFNVQLTAGTLYQIDMVSRNADFDPCLRLEDHNGLPLAANDGKGLIGPQARIMFRPAQTGNYRIIATSVDQKTGPFTVTVRE